MNNLTPVFERETGQVILEGITRRSGRRGALDPGARPGAGLRPCRWASVPGGNRGCRGRRVLRRARQAMLIRLFGPEALSVLTGAGSGKKRPLSPDPGLTATLSSLARLDAARVTSPVGADSPWWAAEAAELAERGGLRVRARAEAHQALVKLLGQLDSLKALPAEAVRAVLSVASIYDSTDPQAARRLREAVRKLDGRPTVSPAGFDVAAEAERLEKSSLHASALHWMLDPHLLPEGLFRPGLSPQSDLVVHDGPNGRVTVQALLAPGAAYEAASRCLVRLVDPVRRHVLAQAAFTAAEDCGGPARVTAKLDLGHPLDEGQDAWIEVVQDKRWPVRSAKGHRIRRALRWADTALRAEQRRPDWPRTPPPRTGPRWPPRPGTTAGATGRPRPIPATPPWLPSATKPPWTRRPAPPRRPPPARPT